MRREMKTGWHYVAALLLGCALVGFYLSIIVPLAYGPGVVPDSSYYIEIARNFLAGKGLVMTGELSDLPAATVPVSFWPPGYPMSVAFLSWLSGIDPVRMAPRVVWACWAFLPAALLFALRPILRSWYVYIAIGLVMFSPGAITESWLPMTDLPFMLLTVLSFGLLFRGAGAAVRPLPLLLSGLTFGLAYGVRNVGVASFVAILGAYAVLALLRIVGAKTALQKLAWWGIGAALVAVPLIVRNLIVFHAFQPYTMPPSTLGYSGNIRYYVSATLGDIIAGQKIQHVVTWNNMIILAVALAAMAAAWLVRTGTARIWRGLPPASKEALVLLCAYVVAGAVVVIAARSRYEWGEFIGPRHVLQYDWILLGLAAFLAERWGRLSRVALSALLIVVVLLAGLRLQFASRELAMRREEVATTMRTQDPSALASMKTGSFRLATNLLITRDPQLLEAIRDLPPATVLVSNYDNVLRLVSGRTVHSLYANGECDLPKLAEFNARKDVARNRMVLLLFADPELLKAGCWQRLAGSPQAGAVNVTRPYFLSFNLQTGRDVEPR